MDEANQPPMPVAPPQPSPAPRQPQPEFPNLPDVSATCPSCGAVVPKLYTFCPNCGKALRAKQLSVTVFSQAWIYLVSVFLPPLGLWPGIKYFRSDDPAAKKIGMIAIGLTVLSTIVTVWASIAIVQYYVGQLNGILNGAELQ
ncbi:MAG TPA: zinc ribbon domain-containing protein [Candidatus Paceibacterota bacterium]|nr:zinc ribbon domain-containing protein [Candidatus Paceibacterota bacterium]